MTKRKLPTVEVWLGQIVGGGQTIATMEDGRKLFVWGGLPGELVQVQLTKKKSKLAEGRVTKVVEPSPERIEPKDPESYLSTSPWQIMAFDAEQHYKAALIEEAFELHDIVLPEPIDVYTDGVQHHYRNKVEFSWYGTSPEQRTEEEFAHVETPSVALSERHLQPELFPPQMREKSGTKPSEDDVAEASNGSQYDTLDLAFFRRGSKGKIVIDDSALLPKSNINLAREIRDFLSTKHVPARNLKTLIIRSDQHGNVVWQLYTKTPDCSFITADEAEQFSAQGGEVIYSDPQSPASRITERLLSVGNTTLTDEILGTPFRYNAESFFQVNIPVYEQALRDMQRWVEAGVGGWGLGVGKAAQPSAAISALKSGSSERHLQPELSPHETRGKSGAKPSEEGTDEKLSNKHRVIDMYAGVGSIGLTIGGDNCTLVEINESAVSEMRRNIDSLKKPSTVKAVLAPSEKALEYIAPDTTIIVDPPRAGLHKDVIARLLEAAPPRIIYLSCNPVTQARDVALLAERYGVRTHRGYNFFPRTPHIEHLVVLDRKH